ncbi:MAG: DUF1311 domain-containing protein [Roseobacter sp.]
MKHIAGVAVALSMGAAASLASPSLECSINASSQVETGQCLADLEETVQAALDVTLKFARQSARELDGVTGRDVALPALETAQARWEDFRAAECDYAGALFGGGSGTGIEIRSCRIELTRQRIKALTARLR